MKKILKYSIIPIVLIIIVLIAFIIIKNRSSMKEETNTELIELQKIEDKLKQGQYVSDLQILDWGKSKISSKDEIKKYANDNALVALIFIETMKDKNYNKATELYEQIDKNSLSIEDLKDYNWDNYEIVNNFEIMENLNCITINLEGKKIWIYVTGNEIIDIKVSTI